MKFKTKTVEIKTSFLTENGATSNKNGFLLTENTKVNLSNKYSVSIPKGTTIHNGSVFGYKEYSNRAFVNDLTTSPGDKPITIKLQINYPIIPDSIRKYIPNFIVKALTEVSIIPYFKCDCWIGITPKTVSIYGKEKFENHNVERKKYIDFMKVKMPDGEFKPIAPFCPYYGVCSSDFPDKVFIDNEGNERTQLEVDMFEIDKITSSRRS